MRDTFIRVAVIVFSLASAVSGAANAAVPATLQMQLVLMSAQEASPAPKERLERVKLNPQPEPPSSPQAQEWIELYSVQHELSSPGE